MTSSASARPPASVSHFDLPPLSLLRDARENVLLRRLGLAGLWNFLGSRFTAAGRGWLFATGVWFLWGVNALELQAHVPLLYAGCLWTGAVLCLRTAKPRLALSASLPARLSAGETCAVHIMAGPHRDAGIRVAPISLPNGLDCSLPEGALVERGSNCTLQLHAQKRGVYTLSGWRAASDYPFGLLRAWQDFAQPARLVVVPSFAPLAYLELGHGHTGTSDSKTPRYQGEADEFSGNRAFREGDAVRHIDWRATARLQDMMVREWHSQPLLRAGIMLDTRAAATQDALFERAVSLCAAVADYCARNGYTVDLFAAGQTVHHLETGPQRPFLDEILDLLASVQRDSTLPPASAAGQPDSLLTLLSPQLEGADTLVFITVGAQTAVCELQQCPGGALKALVVMDETSNQSVAASRDLVYVSPAAQQLGDI